jgi:hypothetical protein
MSRSPRLILTALALLGALAAACGGDDTNPYPSTPCCVAHVYYVCYTAASAGRCLSDGNPDPNGCSLQTPPTCPANVPSQ